VIELSEIAYGGWAKTYRLSNGLIDLITPADVGPRIIRFGFIDDVNEFCEVPEHMGKTGGDKWRLYGGHRFWHAPEHPTRTYFPDNQPVTIEQKADVVQITQAVEPTTGLQKQLDIQMSDDSTHVRLTHRLINHALFTIDCAAWALSVMTTNGTAIIPHPPRGTHPQALLPANSLTLWPYSNMSDPRWTWGEKFILLRQNPNSNTPQKVGVDVRDGWTAYLRDEHLFVKLFAKQAEAIYPDLGCTVETFTNHFMLELETLGPMQHIAPGTFIEHQEDWFLFADVDAVSDDADVERAVLPHIAAAKKQ